MNKVIADTVEEHLQSFIYCHHLFIPLACAECDDSLPFSGASCIPVIFLCLFDRAS